MTKRNLATLQQSLRPAMRAAAIFALVIGTAVPAHADPPAGPPKAEALMFPAGSFVPDVEFTAAVKAFPPQLAPPPLDKTVCEATLDNVSPIWEMRQQNRTQKGPFIVVLQSVTRGQFQPGDFCLEFGAAVLPLQERKGGLTCDGGGQKAEIRHVVAAQTLSLGQLVIKCRT